MIEALVMEAVLGDLKSDARLAGVDEVRESAGEVTFRWRPFDPVSSRLTAEGEIGGKVAIEPVGALLHIAIVLEPVFDAQGSRQAFLEALEASSRVMAGPSAKFFGREGKLLLAVDLAAPSDSDPHQLQAILALGFERLRTTHTLWTLSRWMDALAPNLAADEMKTLADARFLAATPFLGRSLAGEGGDASCTETEEGEAN